MARTTEEMFGSGASDNDDGAAVRDAPPEVVQEPAQDAGPSEPTAVAAKQVVDDKATDAPVVKDDDDAESEHVPDDFEGLKRALAAARGDKRKARKLWQEAEKKVAELEGFRKATAQFAAPQPKPDPVQAPQTPALDESNFFDPEAVTKFVEHRVNTGIASIQQQWFNRNRAAAMERHHDFAEYEAEFIAAVKANPTLGKQADESHDPAEFAYRTGKTLREMQGVNSIDDLKAKFRAEWEAEQAEKSSVAPRAQQVQQQPKPQIPKSLASVRGSGIGTTPAWRGPRSASDLYDG